MHRRTAAARARRARSALGSAEARARPDFRTGTRTSLTSNGVMLGVAVAVVMYSQTRSLYWLLEFIMKSQPPAAEAGLQPSQSGGMAAPIFALYAGPSSFESAQPSPTVASIMP